jgi:hypothetical protein
MTTSDDIQRERDERLQWAAVLSGSAKAEPSDRVTNPAKDAAVAGSEFHRFVCETPLIVIVFIRPRRC